MGSTLNESKNNPEYPNPVSSTKLNQRDQRALVFHLLYATESFEHSTSLEAIAENISREYGYIIVSGDPVFLIASQVSAQRDQLDQEILPLLEHWRFERLSISTKLILRYALWEFLHNQTPTSIIINEAVELAKCFAEKDAYRFINGLLDEWAKQHGRVDTDKPTEEAAESTDEASDQQG